MTDSPKVDLRVPELRVGTSRVLSDGHSVLRSTVFDIRRRDGTWQTLNRETYDRGNGAVILPYDRSRRTVLLVRQFRYPAYVNGHQAPLIEAIAGLLEGQDPLTVACKEAEEEAGVKVRNPRCVFTTFTSPGAVTETLACFIAEYGAADRIGAGGGLRQEGEDIEVLEPDFDDALAMIADGQIVDAKTIMLLQHLRLAGLL
ncbi:NUDIX domain-containing protein [Lichenicoccus sp.]|uniref:NUDIX domain-containing protein n=1 Tax=Lichenicoccus sp. TaxID=2781899 RepID=UPI003D1135E1